MGYPSRRARGPFRALAVFLAVLFPLESTLLPALAQAAPAPTTAASGHEAGVERLRKLLVSGARAGELRSLAREIKESAPASRRESVAAWCRAKIERPLAALADGARPSADYRRRTAADLPALAALLRSQEPSPATLAAIDASARAAHAQAAERAARLPMPDFTPRLAGAVDAHGVPVAPHSGARPAQPAPASASDDADLRERLSQSGDASAKPVSPDALEEFERLRRRAESALAPQPDGGASGATEAQDERWASLEALKRLFDSVTPGSSPASPTLPPAPPQTAAAVEARVARIEQLKAELQAGLASRESAQGLLALADRARAAALADRRSGKDDLEFRKNFSRLAMVMDLSYSLNMLNSADAALGRMQALLDDKVKSIADRRAADAAAGSQAGAQAGHTDAWRKEAEDQTASDKKQAGDFASLAGNVGRVAASVERFRGDVAGLLAAIDARDRGASRDAPTEYDRRLALLPSLRDALVSANSDPSSGVSSLSLSYLQAKSREVAGYVRRVADADARIAAAPVEFAGVLVVAVPGVPDEMVSNPTAAQVRDILTRRRSFWKSQYDEHASLLDSIERSLDASNTRRVLDDFGSSRPESLVAWRAAEQALDDSLAAASDAMAAEADARELVIEAAASGASLTRLSHLSPEELRDRLPELLDRLDALPLPDSDAGYAAKAARIDLSRLAAALGDATARRLEARATIKALRKPIDDVLPKARETFRTAVRAWQAVLDDVTADEAWVSAGFPSSQGQALIDRKRALLSGSLTPALKSLQSLLDDTLVPYQNERILQADPASTGDGYATLYKEKKNLYQRISDGLKQTLPWALASNGAKAYDAGAAAAGIASMRKTFDDYRSVVVDYQDQMRRRKDPNNNETEDLYGEMVPYSLVKRIAVYRAERVSRAASLNKRAAEIDDLLAKMDALEGNKHDLLSRYRLPVDLDASLPATAERLTAMADARLMQNMAAEIKAIADAATAAGGAPSVSVGGGSGGIPTGTQPPLDVTAQQRLALYGLEVVKRLVPTTETGAAGDSYAQSMARYLFADALVTSSEVFLNERIPVFEAFLAKAKAGLDEASADLDADLAWVAGDHSGGAAVLDRKIRVFGHLRDMAAEGAALFEQKAVWSAEGVQTVGRVKDYYDALGETYTSANDALDAELTAARQFQDALAQSRKDIQDQRTTVVGWLGQLNSPNESALARVGQNLSAIQDKTRKVLETNIDARRAERTRDEAARGVEKILRALAAERSALDADLGELGDLARLDPALAARARSAVGQGGAWVAEGPRGPQTLVIPKNDFERFLSQLFGAIAPDAAARDLVSLRESILKDPAALARLLPGSKLVQVGEGTDGFYLVYQTEFSTPGGLETSQQVALGNVLKLWGQNVSVIGHRFASPPSAGNAPFGDQGVTVQVESLDSDHAVNYLDVTFHKFIQDIPSDLTVSGQASEARLLVFDDFALMLAGGKVYFGAAGFADFAAEGASQKPQYYGGNMKARVKFTEVLSLNAEETVLFAKDPRKFLQTVNLDFTKYDPSLDQDFLIEGQGENKNYRRDKVGVGVDLAKALGQKDSFAVDFYYAHTAGTDDITQNSLGATVMKGFTFDLGGKPAVVSVGGGAEAGQKQDSFNGRVAFELPDQGIALSVQGKIIGTGAAYFAELRKKMGDHSDVSLSYGSRYIGLNDRLAVSFQTSYTLGELWRAVTGKAAEDLRGGKALADFDQALSSFLTRDASDPALKELSRVFDADVGRRLVALEIGRLAREVETLTRAGAILDNTRERAVVGFVSGPVGSGTAERATGGGFQAGTVTEMTLTKTQRALIESKVATLYSLGLDLEERLLDLTKDWQMTLADLACARWAELLSGWMAAHADDPVLRAQAEADAAAASDRRRQAQLRYAAITGRGPDETPPFDGVGPQDLDRLLRLLSAALSRGDRLGALLSRARGGLDLPKAGFNALDWVPWVERLTFSIGAQLPDLMSSQALGVGFSVTIPVYDPTRARADASLRLQERATLLEMAARLRQTRLRARGEKIAAGAWSARAAEAAAQQERLAAELSDGIRAYRNALIEGSELRARARRWRDAVGTALEARVQASLQAAWASLDAEQDPNTPRGETYDIPADMASAFDQAAKSAPSWEAMARRSEAARELLAAADRRVRKVDAEVNLSANLTTAGVAFIPAFAFTGLGAWPVVGVTLAPEELRQLDVERHGAEADLYSHLRDKTASDAALGLTHASIDASYLKQEIALYDSEIMPALVAAQDGSAAKAAELASARSAYADLAARQKQTTAALNQLLGRPIETALRFAPDPDQALKSFAERAAALDPVGAARDALASRVVVARAVEQAVDKNLRVDRLRLEPISLIGRSLGRLVAALSGDAVGSPELMALARERTLEAERSLEAFEADLPAARARLAAELSGVSARRQALAGRTDASSRLEDLELARRQARLRADLTAWGGRAEQAADGRLPATYAQLEDRLREAEQRATLPSTAGGDLGAMSSPGSMVLSGTLRWYDAKQTLGGDPIGRQFLEGWVEARLRNPGTPPQALAALAALREEAADERRRQDMSEAEARTQLLLSRLRLGAGLLRWSEGVGLGESARARVAADLAEAAALLRLPPDVRPEALLALMPAESDGDLASVSSRFLLEAEQLDLDSLRATLFTQGLPPEISTDRDALPQLRADLVAERMSVRGFTPLAAFGLFRGTWVQGMFLEAPDPEKVEQTLVGVIDDSLRRELESRDGLKSLGLMLHSLMASVSEKTRLVAAARLREVLARQALRGTLERVRMRMSPVSEGSAAMAEAQAAQEAFLTALYALREDFARLTTELSALGLQPSSYLSPLAARRAGVADEPLARTPRERLLAYWADRMTDEDFARQVDSFLSGQPESVRAQLRLLAQRYRQAKLDADGVRTNSFSAPERLELLVKVDLQGRRRAIEEVLSQVLAGLQGDDPARSQQWACLMGLLRQDVTARAGDAAADLVRADDMRRALRGSFSGAISAPVPVAAEMRKLESLQTRVDDARREALAAWQARTTGAQDHILKDRALNDLVAALDAFDREMEHALSLPAVAKDAAWTRSIDALFDVRESLRRRHDRLAYGRGVLAVDAAIVLDESRLRALRFDPAEARDIGPVSQSLAYLRGLRQMWTGRPDAIPALVALRGSAGTDWATVEDLARAKTQGRVATVQGRDFLAPDDAVGAAPQTAEQALSHGWREVVEGEDAARERLTQARARREEAAREAAFSHVLQSADVVLEPGSPAGARTYSLAELRQLESQGRALWFEASPDARTGLRRQVPAVAARWRDPLELVLMVQTSGAGVPAGHLPTLEALLGAPEAKEFARARIGAAGLAALGSEARREALAARRTGWLKLKLTAWGFALDENGEIAAVYLCEDELRKATNAAADPKDPGHAWRYLRADAVSLGLSEDGTLVAVRVGERSIILGEGTPARWVLQTPQAMETDAQGRVTRLYLDRKELEKAAAGWSLEDSQGRTWQGGDAVPPLLRARRWTDAQSGLTVSLGRELLEERRKASEKGAGSARSWGYSPRNWGNIVVEIPRGIVQTPVELLTGRDPNQQGYLGAVNARRGEGGARNDYGFIGGVLRSIDLFGLLPDPVERYFDPSQYPQAVERDRPLLPGRSAGEAGMRTPDHGKKVFYGAGSFSREARWAAEDQEAARAEVLASFRGGVRRETQETLRGRAGSYSDSTHGLEVGRGAALAAIDELGLRMDPSGRAELSASPRRSAVDGVAAVVSVVVGAQTQEARLRVYEEALKRLPEAAAPEATDAEVLRAEAALTAALAARRAAEAAVKAASPKPALPGYPVMPRLFASVR